ncbi:hypothetical protein V1264_006810 [Littorina saxatilis]|uniref:Uncharacterized protein n=1 Tax=Littorina saxatilis TaxID=31220 RepID=A0AAN9AY79_9CAEN
MNKFVSMLVLVVLAVVHATWAQTVNTGASVGQSGAGGGANTMDLFSILGINNMGQQGTDAFLNSILGIPARGPTSGTGAGNQVGGNSGPRQDNFGGGNMGGGNMGSGNMGGGNMGGGMANNVGGGIPPVPQRQGNSMQMLLPAVAMSSGMDGPWGMMAMAAMNQQRAGMRSARQQPMMNPMMLNFMSGGELFGF